MKGLIVAVWLSGENPPLALAELSGAAQRLGGHLVDTPLGGENTATQLVTVPDRTTAVALSGRLALARRCAEPWPDTDLASIEPRLAALGGSGGPAAFQWVPGSTGNRPPGILHRLARAYRSGGGRISLEHPDRRFWLDVLSEERVRIYEELGRVDRAAVSSRATPHLPFQRPVTLAPRLSLALNNIARVGAGDRVVDPFVGTGSLLLEAALLGAATVGIDADASMIRGALENFAHFGRAPEVLRQADAEAAATEFADGSFDALVTDPPYGRASGTRGEPAPHLWSRALAAWSGKVRRGGRLGIVVPQGSELPDLGARLELTIPQRVHRSLTREFRVYVR